MIKGKRRLVAFLSSVASIMSVEIINPVTGGGLSGNAQIALVGLGALYFANVAIDKYARAKNGQGEPEDA